MILSTAQVARVLKVGRQTLHRWMAEGKIVAPTKRRVGGVVVRLWTERDAERVRRYKAQFYGKGRGRKPGRTAKRPARSSSRA